METFLLPQINGFICGWMVTGLGVYIVRTFVGLCVLAPSAIITSLPVVGVAYVNVKHSMKVHERIEE